MILISNLKLPADFDFKAPIPFIANALNLKTSNINSVVLYRRSIDARKKSDVHFCCSFLVELKENEDEFIKKTHFKNVSVYNTQEYVFKKAEKKPSNRPIVIGFGPGGIFAALTLARAGLCPIVFEMGENVDKRAQNIETFFKTGKLNPRSNVQFGEGGAGAFSDGKLTTGIKDIRLKTILKEFFLNGAPEEILYDAKPHIGTDILRDVIKNIREEIISLGGEVNFSSKLVDLQISEEKLSRITIEQNGKEIEFDCDNLILAIGHSARNTIYMLKEKGLKMERKPFAVGVRIEHSQRAIDRSQLGNFSDTKQFSPSDYKLSTHLKNGRGVYSFCMCPGGEVINSSSEEGGVCVNGMSYHSRNGENANSALLVSVEPSDFEGDDVLAGIDFQRKIEQATFALGQNYLPVSQTLGDFFKGKPSQKCGKIKPTAKSGVLYGDIRKVLPRFVTDALAEGIIDFDKKLRGFADENALLTAPETRSSSPVRMNRDNKKLSNIMGIFPCAEGAGYAGGIMSAAVDGIKCAEALIERIEELG